MGVERVQDRVEGMKSDVVIISPRQEEGRLSIGRGMSERRSTGALDTVIQCVGGRRQESESGLVDSACDGGACCLGD